MKNEGTSYKVQTQCSIGMAMLLTTHNTRAGEVHFTGPYRPTLSSAACIRAVHKFIWPYLRLSFDEVARPLRKRARGRVRRDEIAVDARIVISAIYSLQSSPHTPQSRRPQQTRQRARMSTDRRGTARARISMSHPELRPHGTCNYPLFFCMEIKSSSHSLLYSRNWC